MAKIRIREDRSEAEFLTPAGDVFGTDQVDEITVVWDKEGKYLAVAGDFEGLKSNSMYRLVEIPCEVELDAEIEDSDDEEDEDEVEVEEVDA